MTCVKNKPVMLNVVMLSVILLSAVTPATTWADGQSVQAPLGRPRLLTGHTPLKGHAHAHL